MEIFINDEKTAFELENEETALDVLNAISDYALKSKPQQFLTKIKINDKEYSFANEESVKSIKIDKINKMEIETSDIYGITNLSIDQIDGFLKLLFDIFKNKTWDSSISKVSDSVNWMKNGINQIIRIFGSKGTQLENEESIFVSNCDKLHDVFINFSPEKIAEDDKMAVEVLNYIKEMKASLSKIREGLVKSYKLPDKEYILVSINNIINTIEEISPKLENIPVMFQTGEDREAMNIIQSLADILDDSISLFVVFKESLKLHMDKYTVKEVSFEEFFKIITEHLRELMEAIQNSDSIMIGDLLEYEFVPNLEEIKTILTKIRDEAFTKVN